MESLHSSISLSWQADVVDLEDHADELSRERDLLFLRQKGLDDVLRLHVIRSLLQAIDAQARIVLFHLQKNIGFGKVSM